MPSLIEGLHRSGLPINSPTDTQPHIRPDSKPHPDTHPNPSAHLQTS